MVAVGRGGRAPDHDTWRVQGQRLHGLAEGGVASPPGHREYARGSLSALIRPAPAMLRAPSIRAI